MKVKQDTFLKQQKKQLKELFKTMENSKDFEEIVLRLKETYWAEDYGITKLAFIELAIRLFSPPSYSPYYKEFKRIIKNAL